MVHRIISRPGPLWFFLILLFSSMLSDPAQAQLVEPNHIQVPINHMNLMPGTGAHVLDVTGYLPGEGYLDLHHLTFAVTAAPTSSSRTLSTTIDVAVVRVPPDTCPTPPTTWQDIPRVCPLDQWQAHVGLGSPDPDDTSSWTWCCNTNHPAAVCATGQSPTTPSLIVHSDEVQIDDSLRHVTVVQRQYSSTTMSLAVQDAQFETLDDDGGFIVVLLASCNPQGVPVTVNGTVDFISFAEEIQDIVDEEVPFYGFTSLAYMSLFFWYAHLMHQYAESRIDLEEWIFGTIAIGFAQSLLRFVEFIAWRRAGHRNGVVALLAAVAYGAKHGVSRGLLVLLCSGVGVTRASLDRTAQVTLWIMTASYIVLSTIVEYLDYVEQAREKGHLMGTAPQGFLLDIEAYLLTAMLWIDLVFVFWIPMALRSTMILLRTTGQERKLERFRQLVRIICIAVSISILAIVFIILDIVYDEGQWAFKFDFGDVGEFNLFLILFMVAILWRPNPMAREYAYVMEAPTEEVMSGSGSTHDLELVETSAVAHGNGTPPDDDVGADYKSFPIDSAEAT